MEGMTRKKKQHSCYWRRLISRVYRHKDTLTTPEVLLVSDSLPYTQEMQLCDGREGRSDLSCKSFFTYLESQSTALRYLGIYLPTERLISFFFFQS